MKNLDFYFIEFVGSYAGDLRNKENVLDIPYAMVETMEKRDEEYITGKIFVEKSQWESLVKDKEIYLDTEFIDKKDLISVNVKILEIKEQAVYKGYSFNLDEDDKPVEIDGKNITLIDSNVETVNFISYKNEDTEVSFHICLGLYDEIIYSEDDICYMIDRDRRGTWMQSKRMISK